jgi:hypothetical protein
MSSGEYGVQVEIGELVTSHRVEVAAPMLADLGLEREDAPRVVRASMQVLLERPTGEEIAPVVSLEALWSDDREFAQQLRERLKAAS